MKKNKKGFTLAELLIVVAIIGVLVAISIPIFNNQLEEAREATDAVNIRSQYAQVMADAITEESDIDGKALYGAIALKQKSSDWQDASLKSNLEGVFGEVDGSPASGGSAWVTYDSAKGYSILHYDGSSNSGSAKNGNAKQFVTYRTEQSADAMQKWLTTISNNGYRNWKNGESIVIDGTVYVSLDGGNNINGKTESEVAQQVRKLTDSNKAIAITNADTVLNYDDIMGTNTAITKGTIIYGGSGWHNAPKYYIAEMDTTATSELNNSNIFKEVY